MPKNGAAKAQKTGASASGAGPSGVDLSDPDGVDPAGADPALMLSKPASKAPTPEGPPPPGVFFQQQTGVNEDESYGDDEKALNTFLKLHPMLSTEASSVKTLASVANLFHKAAVQVGDLPTVTKTHDDLFLRPANTRIGERPCINDDRCLAKFLAQVRFGADSPKAFTCTEFLLPDVHKRFLDGRGLPPRRSKCILCYRYFTTFVYTAARADPSFRAIEASGLGVQAFQNSICPPADAAPADDLAQLERDVGTGPSHASALNCQDGYAAHAALFVDEAFSQQRAGREDKLGALAFRPQVRFDSSHYRYVLDAGGPRIEQVGIGAQDTLSPYGLHFPPPAAPSPPALSAAEKGPPR